MNKRPTPESDAFYSTFADGLASPSQDEWLERLKRYERQRDGLLEALEEYGLSFEPDDDARAELGDFQVDRELRRRAALSTARANFP